MKARSIISLALALVAATIGAATSIGDSDRDALAARGSAKPFAATQAAAVGREVPAQVPDQYVDISMPRVVGSDPATGQEYAISSGTGGNCLIAVREPGRAGFESCGPNTDRDSTMTVALGGGRIRTIVLQAAAASEPSTMRAAGGGTQVAPGLWVSESAGSLPGG